MCLSLCLSVCLCCLLLLLVSLSALSALQTYVATPDDNYSWSRLEQFDEQGMGYKIMWLNMTSQRWLTDKDVSQSIWWRQ